MERDDNNYTMNHHNVMIISSDSGKSINKLINLSCANANTRPKSAINVKNRMVSDRQRDAVNCIVLNVWN